MKKKFKLVMSCLLLVGLLVLSGCGQSDQVTLKVYNWGDYIDPSVIDQFEQETGIKVIYETFATNEEMYVKLKTGGSSYDVAIPSDYMIKKMINEDMLHKIDYDKVPNVKYIDDRFKDLAYDVNNEYSIPYMWGTVGILYNKTMVDEAVDSWDILWDEKYAKQILMLDSQRETIGLALQKLGYSLNSRDDAELQAAKEELLKQKPLVLAYVGDEVKDKMISGEAALAVVWSGDAVYMQRENPDLAYVIPKEGSNIWFDSMVIPKKSQHKEEAEMFIDFMCRTDIATKNADYIGYSTPHADALKNLPEELINNPTYNPPEEELTNLEVYEDLSEVLPKYDSIWMEIKSADIKSA